ncbi:hypothetical protein [Pedobacter gandavensis]|uniref:Uncharacterized protein n=1 Tax=Pedobacter gandavensis TaxID=2679963 RepID=A0ABR6F2I1_9SPHI|nr:hypothetical protein [Pedobacter gandavensis]MBB2151646.1 hypothetical protein [Pedobacter gandavensis]
MRLLLSAIFFFFSQVISLQTAQGKGVTQVSPYVSKSNFNTKKHYFNPLSKDRTSLKKVFREDLSFINHPVQKQSLNPWFYLKGTDKTLYIPLVVTRTYHIFQNFGYSYIFNFLYPKHVFW